VYNNNTAKPQKKEMLLSKIRIVIKEIIDAGHWASLLINSPLRKAMLL
jgi:hypothetical protein